MYDNVPWYALTTEHSRFAITARSARKYPADVSPFAGTPDNSPASLRQLAALLDPDEAIHVMAETLPAVAELKLEEQIEVLQMFASAEPPPLLALPGVSIQKLTAEDAPEMVALTDLAFPGYFRVRTCEMGAYYGIRIDRRLIAMAGERMNLPRDREISGVCTHPDHTGKGYAALLMTRLMHDHARADCRSYLHVKSGNARAIGIYQRLGFITRRELLLHRVSRTA